MKQLPHVPNSSKPHPQRRVSSAHSGAKTPRKTPFMGDFFEFLRGLRPALLAGVSLVIHVRLRKKRRKHGRSGSVAAASRRSRRCGGPLGPALGRSSAEGRGEYCQAARGTCQAAIPQLPSGSSIRLKRLRLLNWSQVSSAAQDLPSLVPLATNSSCTKLHDA